MDCSEISPGKIDGRGIEEVRPEDVRHARQARCVGGGQIICPPVFLEPLRKLFNAVRKKSTCEASERGLR